jgi:hypothetical protein
MQTDEEATPKSKKRKADSDNGTVSLGPIKKVAFAGDAKKSKMFTAAEQEQLDATVGQNKQIAKAAKKAKKRSAKAQSAEGAEGMDTAEDGPAEEAEDDLAYLGFEKRAGALSLGSVEEADGEGTLRASSSTGPDSEQPTTFRRSLGYRASSSSIRLLSLQALLLDLPVLPSLCLLPLRAPPLPRRVGPSPLLLRLGLVLAHLPLLQAPER